MIQKTKLEKIIIINNKKLGILSTPQLNKDVWYLDCLKHCSICNNYLVSSNIEYCKNDLVINIFEYL